MSEIRHFEEIDANRQSWRQHPALRAAYTDLHRRVALAIPEHPQGQLIELGSGIATLKETIPTVITTDLQPNEGIDRVADAYDLPFEDNSLAALILIDTWHHLERPGAFLKEANRALHPNGRVILLEPYISLCGRLVYGPLHPEPIGKPKDINWSAQAPETRQYFAAQGSATWAFFSDKRQPWADHWRLVEATRFSCFAYWGTGGFSGPKLFNLQIYKWARKLDRHLDHCPRVFAGRCLVILESRSNLA